MQLKLRMSEKDLRSFFLYSSMESPDSILETAISPRGAYSE